MFELFPGSGAVFIRNAGYLMKGLVNILLIARRNLNASLIQDVLHMTKIA
jgi:hypothetical protein